MPCGLYGKLPAKRDFIAVNMPRDFLKIWEEWLHGAISSSRLKMGQDWLPAYLKAPLWRFWLGEAICGIPVSGVFMPSVDGIGRHFPLSIFCYGDKDDAFKPPFASIQLNENPDWYEKVEYFLLSTLEAEIEYDNLLNELQFLPLLQKIPAMCEDISVLKYSKNNIRSVALDETIEDAFASIQKEENRLLQRNKSYWWTVGGDSFQPFVFTANGMPNPDTMEIMLSGNLNRTKGEH